MVGLSFVSLWSFSPLSVGGIFHSHSFKKTKIWSCYFQRYAQAHARARTHTHTHTTQSFKASSQTWHTGLILSYLPPLPRSPVFQLCWPSFCSSQTTKTFLPLGFCTLKNEVSSYISPPQRNLLLPSKLKELISANHSFWYYLFLLSTHHLSLFKIVLFFVVVYCLSPPLRMAFP